MAAGNTITDSLADSIPTMIASARIVREFAGVMPNLVDRQRLDENTGTVWNEVSMAKLSAQAVTESTELDNPQQMSDTLFSITPTVIGVHTIITDRVALRISANAYAQTGSLAQNAIERKKDQDGLTAIDGATTSLGAAGAGLDTSDISSAAYRITSNTTEPAPATAPIHGVFHGFQLADIDFQLTNPGISVVSSGTIAEAQAGAPLTSGIAAEAFQNRYRGNIAGARLYEDGNLTIDSLSLAVVRLRYSTMMSTHMARGLRATGSMRSSRTHSPRLDRFERPPRGMGRKAWADTEGLDCS